MSEQYEEMIIEENNQDKQESMDEIINKADEDSELFSEKINDLSNLFRKEIMSRFFEMKGILDDKNGQRMTRLQQRKDSQLQQAQHRIDKLQERIAIRQHYLKKFQSLTLNLAGMVSNTRERSNDRYLKKVSFASLKTFLMEARREKAYTYKANRHYARSTMKKILRAWHVHSLHTKLTRNRLDGEAKRQAEMGELRNTYNQHLESLEIELGEAKEKLRKEEKDKVILQENMKKSIMRGVCDINNKFLQIIKHANDHGPFLQLPTEQQQQQLLAQQYENIDPNMVQQKQQQFHSLASQLSQQSQQSQMKLQQLKQQVRVERAPLQQSQVHKRQYPIPKKRKPFT